MSSIRGVDTEKAARAEAGRNEKRALAITITRMLVARLSVVRPDYLQTRLFFSSVN